MNILLNIPSAELSAREYTIIGVLMLVITGLSWFVKYLLKENKDKDKAILTFTKMFYTMAGQMQGIINVKPPEDV